MASVESTAQAVGNSVTKTYYITVSYPGHGPLEANIPVVATSSQEAREKALKIVSARLSAWVS